MCVPWANRYRALGYIPGDAYPGQAGMAGPQYCSTTAVPREGCAPPLLCTGARPRNVVCLLAARNRIAVARARRARGKVEAKCGFHPCTEAELAASALRARISWSNHLLLPDYARCPAAPPARFAGPPRFSNPRYVAERAVDPAHAAAWNGVGSPHDGHAPAHWLVSPEHNLMVCAIEKVGTTQWIELFRAALDQQSGHASDGWRALQHWKKESELPALEAIAPQQRAAMWRCPTLHKVVVVRDPLERLLSAYLDKCAFAHEIAGNMSKPVLATCVGLPPAPRTRVALRPNCPPTDWRPADAGTARAFTATRCSARLARATR